MPSLDRPQTPSVFMIFTSEDEIVLLNQYEPWTPIMLRSGAGFARPQPVALRLHVEALTLDFLALCKDRAAAYRF